MCTYATDVLQFTTNDGEIISYNLKHNATPEEKIECYNVVMDRVNSDYPYNISQNEVILLMEKHPELLKLFKGRTDSFYEAMIRKTSKFWDTIRLVDEPKPELYDCLYKAHPQYYNNILKKEHQNYLHFIYASINITTETAFYACEALRIVENTQECFFSEPALLHLISLNYHCFFKLTNPTLAEKKKFLQKHKFGHCGQCHRCYSDSTNKFKDCEPFCKVRYSFKEKLPIDSNDICFISNPTFVINFINKANITAKHINCVAISNHFQYYTNITAFVKNFEPLIDIEQLALILKNNWSRFAKKSDDVLLLKFRDSLSMDNFESTLDVINSVVDAKLKQHLLEYIKLLFDREGITFEHYKRIIEKHHWTLNVLPLPTNCDNAEIKSMLDRVFFNNHVTNFPDSPIGCLADLYQLNDDTSTDSSSYITDEPIDDSLKTIPIEYQDILYKNTCRISYSSALLAIKTNPLWLQYIPDYLITRNMCKVALAMTNVCKKHVPARYKYLLPLYPERCNIILLYQKVVTRIDNWDYKRTNLELEKAANSKIVRHYLTDAKTLIFYKDYVGGEKIAKAVFLGY